METRDLAAFTTDQVKFITTDQLKAFTTDQVVNLRSAQLQSISSDTLKALRTDQLAALTSTQIATLSADQVGALSTDQMKAFKAANLGSLKTDQIRAMGAAGIAKLSSDQVVALTSLQFPALTSDQIRALTTDQVKVIETRDLVSLSTDQIRRLTTDQIRSMTTDQITSLTSNQIKVITTDSITKLTTDQVVALNSTQFGALTTDQIKQFTTDQIKVIESRDLVKLTTEQLCVLSTDQVRALTSGQLAGLSTTTQLFLFTKTTPLVLDLNQDGIQTLALGQGVVFDVNGDGQSERTGWVSSQDGLLARDLNGDGQINDGSELFGEGTTLADGTKAKDGYVALNALDTNLDGLIDANDAAFGQLSVWVDRNGDAKTNSGELASLTELGITSISLNAQSSTAVNNGNLIGLMGSYTTADGRTHTMGDVWFSVDTDGSRVFDLSAVIDKTGTVPYVDLNASPAATLNVSLQDVLTLGNQDLGSGLTTVRIDGGTDDTVQLAQADGNWTQSGTVTDGAESYAIYVNQEAQLLVNQKIHTQII